jgi:hypothetical protein
MLKKLLVVTTAVLITAGPALAQTPGTTLVPGTPGGSLAPGTTVPGGATTSPCIGVKCPCVGIAVREVPPARIWRRLRRRHLRCRRPERRPERRPFRLRLRHPCPCDEERRTPRRCLAEAFVRSAARPYFFGQLSGYPSLPGARLPNLRPRLPDGRSLGPSSSPSRAFASPCLPQQPIDDTLGERCRVSKRGRRRR